MTDYAGITVYNDDGVIQIDQDHPVLQLRQKGSVTLSSGSSADPYIGTVTYNNANEFPILAFKPTTTTDVSIISVSRSGNTVTWQVAGLVSATVDYYVFDRPVASSDHCGLEIFDASGACVFSCAAPPLKVAQVIQWDGTDINLTIPSGKAYAITMYGETQCRVTDHEDTSATPPIHTTTYVCWLNYTAYLVGGVIHSHASYEVYYDYGNGTGPGDGYGISAGNSGNQRLMIIDVSQCDSFTF